MAWEVQHYTIADGWTNTWTECVDGMRGDELTAEGLWRPVQFEMKEEAEDALAQFFQEVLFDESDADGEVDGIYEFSEFRVREVAQ